MVILIYGNDATRRNEKYKELSSHFAQKYDPSMMNAAEYIAADIGTLLQAIKTPPFLSEKRFIVATETLSSVSKKDEEAWAELIESCPDSTILVFVESKPGKSFISKISTIGTVYEINELGGSDLRVWIESYVEEQNGSIEPSATRLLESTIGPNLERLKNELSKLLGFANGDAITAQMTEELVELPIKDQLFAFVDAISRKNTKQAIDLLKSERERGIDDGQLFTMFMRQIRLLLQLRSALDDNPSISSQICAKQFGMHPFVAKKTLAQAKQYSLSSLQRAHDILFRLEQAIKTGKTDTATATELLLFSFR